MKYKSEFNINFAFTRLSALTQERTNRRPIHQPLFPPSTVATHVYRVLSTRASPSHIFLSDL